MLRVLRRKEKRKFMCWTRWCQYTEAVGVAIISTVLRVLVTVGVELTFGLVVCSVNGDHCHHCQDAAGVKKKKYLLAVGAVVLVIAGGAGYCRCRQDAAGGGKNLAVTAVVIAVVNVGNAGYHCRHPWQCWLWSSSSSSLWRVVVLVAAVNAGSLGLGCHASLLSSTLGMGVDVMDIDSTEDKSVS